MRPILLLAVFVVLTLWVGYYAERPEFLAFILVYGALFAAYGAVLHFFTKSLLPLQRLLGVAFGLRVLLLFSPPNLSDDVYRFLWDGRLAAQGIHPFAYTPAQIMEGDWVLVGITPELFALLNSPDYYTVYPPVCQGVFWLAAKIFPESIPGGVFVLKAFLLAAELLAVWVLRKWRPDSWAVAAYALHPLVLLEGVGNGHFEVAMLAFLLTGIWMLQPCLNPTVGMVGKEAHKRLALAALFWALAVAVKLLPLLFLPILWVWLRGRARWLFMGYFAVFCALLFLPLWDWAVLQNLFSSLRLYFRQFAFNASIYYVLRELLMALGFKTVVQARLLGPLLGGLVFVGVWAIAFYRRKASFVPLLTDRMMLAATLYLLLATTVHPWYVLVPFALSLVAERKPTWCYPMVWTATVAFSYSHYIGGSFQEKYGWIALEYLFVAAALLWDFTRPSPSESPGKDDVTAAPVLQP